MKKKLVIGLAIVGAGVAAWFVYKKFFSKAKTADTVVPPNSAPLAPGA